MLRNRTEIFLNVSSHVGIPQAVKGFCQNVFDFCAAALCYLVEEMISAPPQRSIAATIEQNARESKVQQVWHIWIGPLQQIIPDVGKRGRSRPTASSEATIVKSVPIGN
jgi:hypothetical protein